MISDFGGIPHECWNFYTENSVFKFTQKEVKEIFICINSEYAPDEVFQILKLISADNHEIILNPGDHYYFGFVVLDLISAGTGKVTCNIGGKLYGSDPLKEFDINQEQKGGIRLFGKRKMPSMSGGKGYECPEDRELISRITWRT